VLQCVVLGAIVRGLVLSLVLVACSAPAEDDEPPPASTCAPGELVSADGCIAPGIAPELCAEGFEPDGARGCVAVLPSMACGFGEMAVPGETACGPVAPCARGRWGDIPRDPLTQHVDLAYAGVDSDGSEERPYKSIQDAIDAATPGATIAVADGVYIEGLSIAGKAVLLRGRCPATVEVRGTTGPAIDVRAGADGTAISGLAVTGQKRGLWIDGASVELEGLWIHDTLEPGIIAGNSQPASVSLRRSLIEQTAGAGVVVGGVELTIEQSVLRSAPTGAGGPGIGIYALRSQAMLTPAQLTVRGSLIENNDNAGIVMTCANATIEGSVVRDNRAAGADVGGGIVAGRCSEDLASSLRVSGSIVERNTQDGVTSLGVDTEIDTTVIRDVWFTENNGIGLLVMPDPYTLRIATVSLTRSLVERSFTAGASAQGGTLMIESAIVRDTQPSPITGVGDGVLARPGWSGEPGSATLRGTILQRNHAAGAFALGADMSLERVWIDETRASSPFAGGWGVAGSYLPDNLIPAQLSLVDSVVTQSAGFGVLVVSSQASIAGTRVAETGPSLDNRFGDGILVVTGEGVPEAPRPNATITGSVIEASARAGLANFGADIVFEKTTWSCNAIHLNGESDFFSSEHHTFSFDDRGGNSCGCGDSTGGCSVVSSQLDPPQGSIDRPAVPKPW